MLFPNMHVTLRSSTGTISGLWTDIDTSFCYVPRDGAFGANRSLPGYLALGDIAMRVRSTQGPLNWHHELQSRICIILAAFTSLQRCPPLLSAD